MISSVGRLGREGRVVVGRSGGGEPLLLVEVVALTAGERETPRPGRRRCGREAGDIDEAKTSVSGEALERVRVRVLGGE